MCPTCKTTLDQSSAPIADRIRQFISARIAAGDTKSEIKRKLVAQFGPAVLAEPSKHGFNLLAWVLPFVGARARGGGARRAGLALVARRGEPLGDGRRRTARPGARPPGGRRACSLRIAAVIASTGSQIPVAFAVGFVSIVLPVRPAARPRLPVGRLRGRGAAASASRGWGGGSRSRACRSSPGSRSCSSCSAPARRRSAASSTPARRPSSPASSSS